MEQRSGHGVGRVLSAGSVIGPSDASSGGRVLRDGGMWSPEQGPPLDCESEGVVAKQKPFPVARGSPCQISKSHEPVVS